jgi:hypothetical protein
MRYLQGTATAVQRNDLAAEQALALDLGATVEMPTRPAGITIDSPDDAIPPGAQ